MNENNYIDCINTISQQAKNIMSNSWTLNNVEKLTDAELILFFIQFNYFVQKFPQYIGALIYNSENPFVRNILIKNLIDELGSSENIENNNITKAHCNLYIKFLHSFGISEKMIEEANPLPCTIKFIETCDNIYLNSHILKSLAAFGPGNEGIPKWNKIYEYLKKLDRFKEEDLSFFSVHLNVDGHHNDEILEAILLNIKNKDDLLLIRDGIMEMIWARYDFYTDLYKAMKNINVALALL